MRVPASERARWALLGVALILGVTLIATTWASHRGTVRAASQLTRSQGEALLTSIRAELRSLGDVADGDDLEVILDRHRDARYLALFEPRDEVILAAAGDRVTTGPLPRLGPTDRGWSKSGDYCLLVASAGGSGPEARPPGRHPRPFGDRRAERDTGPPREPGARSPRDDRRRPAPRGPWLAIEYEASTARGLLQQTAGTLAVATASAVLLMVAGLLFWQQARAREQAQRRLEQQERLSTLGEMSAVLAHEIRNPLASLKGHAQLLAERINGDHPEARKVRWIVDEATRLEKLTTDLLGFVRSGALSRELIDPVVLVEELCDELDRDRIRVLAEHAPAVWSLDRARIRQVLSNLLRNAIQVSPAHGVVDVTIDVDRGTPGLELRFVVRDRGSGLPVGKEREIFEPFFTTRTRGTGLGLAVAQRIVELHHGTLSGRNHPGGGAELEVRIPQG
ncbi:MAG: ATP-binding protein [Acidobacteriota bacterium]